MRWRSGTRAVASSGAALLVSLAGGCSFGIIDVSPCEANADCRDAFGLGSACAADGYCELVDIPARCLRTYPEDLFDDPESYQDAVVLGSVYDETAFPLEVQSIDLAVFHANDGGGLDGEPFAVIHCTNHEDGALDDLSQDEANEASAVFLTETLDVPTLIGPATSARTEAAFLAVSDTLVISPSATSVALTALDETAPSDDAPGLLWRTAPPDSLQGEVIAGDMLGRLEDIGGAPSGWSVAVIYRPDSYGEGLTEEFERHWSGAGGAASRFSFSSSSELSESVTDVGSGAYHEVLFISSEKEDITAFLNAAAVLNGYQDKAIFLTDGAYDTDILDDAEAASALFEQIRGTVPTPPAGTVYEAFLASFSAFYQGQNASDSGFTAQAYDATWLALYGAAWSVEEEGGLSGPGSARGLRRISDGAVVELRSGSWEPWAYSFADGAGIDVVGASGALDYDPDTEETSGPVAVWAVAPTGQGFEVLYTVEP